MTETIDTAQTEALRIAAALEYCDASVARQAINELRRLHAALAAAEAENDLLRQHAAKQINDSTLLTGINIGNGSMDIGMQGGAARVLAESFFDQFIESGAENFLEVRFDSQEKLPGKSMVVTLQLVDGLTPAQKIAELKAALAAAEARNATLTDEAARWQWLSENVMYAEFRQRGYVNYALWGRDASAKDFAETVDAEIAKGGPITRAAASISTKGDGP